MSDFILDTKKSDDEKMVGYIPGLTRLANYRPTIIVTSEITTKKNSEFKQNERTHKCISSKDIYVGNWECNDANKTQIPADKICDQVNDCPKDETDEKRQEF